MKTKQFTHKFSDGQVITLLVDLSGDAIRVASSLSMRNQPQAIRDEFVRWEHEVVNPEMMKAMTPIQVANMACYAVKKGLA